MSLPAFDLTFFQQESQNVIAANSPAASIACDFGRNHFPRACCNAATFFLAVRPNSPTLTRVRNVDGGETMSLSRSLNALMIGAAFAFLAAVVLGVLP
ncbi:MAG: hypothetical protein IPL47_08680 [Phyllobacteriaceae bacterium]|nr:hypothetical protein [Phyllobacteriaceae bacterium]